MWPYCGQSVCHLEMPRRQSRGASQMASAKPRVRSMSMNVYLGGWAGTDGNWDWVMGAVCSDYRIYLKQSDLADPGPARIFVFLDMREDSIDMGNFATRMAGWPDQPELYGFFDLPGYYHHFAGGFLVR